MDATSCLAVPPASRMRRRQQAVRRCFFELSAKTMTMGHARTLTVPTPPSAATLTLEFEGAPARLGLVKHEEAMRRLPVLSPIVELWAQFVGTTLCLGRRGDVGETPRVQHSEPLLGRRSGCDKRESPGTLPTSTSKLRNGRGYGITRCRRRLHNAWLRCANASRTASAPGGSAVAARATLARRVRSSTSFGRRSRVPPRLQRPTPHGTQGSPDAPSLIVAT